MLGTWVVRCEKRCWKKKNLYYTHLLTNEYNLVLNSMQFIEGQYDHKGSCLGDTTIVIANYK
jgi:hypothetical protein